MKQPDKTFPKMVKTFREFSFAARHSLAGKSKAAATLHTHHYTICFWFSGEPDQEHLYESLELAFGKLRDGNLNEIIGPNTTDERLAEWFMNACSISGCIGVRVTNDGVRGAEIYK